MSLAEINDSVSIIQNEAHDDANIIFGAVIDEEMGEAVNVTVIATGFGNEEKARGRFEEPRERIAAPQQVVVEPEKPDESGAWTYQPKEPEDTQVPAFIRRSRREKSGRHMNIVQEYPVETEEDLDIPTFLRKQAD
jgi:cell division protein FtsZ